MQKKMEATRNYIGVIRYISWDNGIMEKKMETTRDYRDYVGVIRCIYIYIGIIMG